MKITLLMLVIGCICFFGGDVFATNFIYCVAAQTSSNRVEVSCGAPLTFATFSFPINN